MSRHHDPFETYLFRVFCLLMSERSVSRTAARLNQSQPAVSAALKRLRDIFGDPLLVKDKQTMVPTERALQIEPVLRSVLDDLDRLMAPPELFEAASSSLSFRIGMPDYLAPSFPAAVVRYLRQQAPHARLVVLPLGPDFDFEAALADGRLDVVIGNWPTPPEHLRLTVLLEDDVVCLVCRQHPATRQPLTATDYLDGSHVVPMTYSVMQRGVVETRLAQARLSRDATVTVPYFSLAPYLLPGTDLIFTTSRHFAEHFAALLPLTVLPAPLDFPPMRFYQLWHSRAQHSQSHAWLRSVLSAVARTATPIAPLAGPAVPASERPAPSSRTRAQRIRS